MKRCCTCGETKPLGAFPRARNRPDGLYPSCRDCKNALNRAWRERNRDSENQRQRDRWKYLPAEEKERFKARMRERYVSLAEEYNLASRYGHLRREYGLTPQQYDELLEQQTGVCAVCECPETKLDHRTKRPRQLAVDHCHETGQIRGLLCQDCNQALGKLGESVERVKRLLHYLEGGGHYGS